MHRKVTQKSRRPCIRVGAWNWRACRCVASVVPIIAAAPVPAATRAKWLDRLFEAIQEDDPPYLESLGDHWGDLCATPELASHWAYELMPHVRRTLVGDRRGGFHCFAGTVSCYSALFKARRHDELLGLLALDRHPIWPCLIWGGRVLAACGQVDEANRVHEGAVRFRGLAKNTAHVITLFALSNLWMARRRLLAMTG
jgi:hypothetical protein